jgi:hypothetical protein
LFYTLLPVEESDESLQETGFHVFEVEG